MRPQLYLLLLAGSISAAAPLAELLSSLQQIQDVMAKDRQSLRIETPGNVDDSSCASTIFAGVEELRTHPATQNFALFFQKLERLKPSLTPSLAEGGQCDTERRKATIFLQKLTTFLRKASKSLKRVEPEKLPEWMEI